MSLAECESRIAKEDNGAPPSNEPPSRIIRARYGVYHLLLRHPWLRGAAQAGVISLRCGSVMLGLGPAAKLPVSAGYFTQHKLQRDPGVGVEIVLKVDDVHAVYT